jgi:hypothetical protein
VSLARPWRCEVAMDENGDRGQAATPQECVYSHSVANRSEGLVLLEDRPTLGTYPGQSWWSEPVSRLNVDERSPRQHWLVDGASMLIGCDGAGNVSRGWCGLYVSRETGLRRWALPRLGSSVVRLVCVTSGRLGQTGSAYGPCVGRRVLSITSLIDVARSPCSAASGTTARSVSSGGCASVCRRPPVWPTL